MIDREALDKVTTIYTHANCPDGAASAILLHDVLEGANVVFLQHGSPAYNALASHEGALFCDITPPPHAVDGFVEKGAIVLDHHEKQKDITLRFGERGVYSDKPGCSGAMLAFEQVWSWSTTEGSDSWSRAKDFATLAGIRDTWQKDHRRWKQACAQAEALRFYPWAVFEQIDSPFRGSGAVKLNQLLDLGTVLVHKQEQTVTNIIEGAYGRQSAKGTHVMMMNTRNVSDVAEVVRDEVDVVIGFTYHNVEGKIVLELSCRAKTVDVGALCKSLGGGGHKLAAGARVTLDYETAFNPYQEIMHLVDDFEHKTHE